MMQREDRVQRNTKEQSNVEIAADAERRVRQAVGESPGAISRRIDRLEEEWDIERWLEANASALAFSGVLLGLFVNKKFFAIPCLVLPFLFQHALQGWCPPVPFLRRNGVRTRREIDAEKFALKALRGDFDKITAATASTSDGAQRGREVWQAVNA